MPGTMISSELPVDAGGGDRVWLGQLGHVAALKHSDTRPGGPEILTCTLQADPTSRHRALYPGRVISGWRGGSCTWNGYLDDPAPGDDGWSISAAGTGTWGSRFRAVYGAGTDVDTFVPADVLGRAIEDGLPWAIGSMTGAFLTDVRDSGSLSITEYMNLLASPAGKTWRVRNVAGQWQVDIVSIPTLPTQVTRLLVAPGQVARTLAGYVNELFVRYQATADQPNKPATYAVISTEGAGSDLHGASEGFWDLSSSGVMTAGAATALGTAVLAKYQAASWSGPFVVSPGQYLTTGGTPVDLGCEKAGEMVRVIFSTGPYGGEISPAPPILFPVGKINYDDDSGTAEITPMQAWNGDIAAVMDLLAPKAPA